MMVQKNGNWAIDKRIPVSVIITMLIAGGGLIGSWAQLNSRVDSATTIFAQRMEANDKAASERIQLFSDQRKEQTAQNEKKFDLIANQMLEMQRTSNQLIVKSTEVSSDVKSLAQGVNDIKESLRKK